TEPTLRAHPHCTVAIEVETTDKPIPEPVPRAVRRTNVSVIDVSDSTHDKSNPEAALQWISGEGVRRVSVAEGRPRNLLDGAVSSHAKQPEILVGHPDIAAKVFGDSRYNSPRNAAQDYESLMLQVSDPAARGDPNSAANVLKQGFDDVVG